MATGTWKWYGLGLEKWLEGSIDFASDTIKVGLSTSSYTPNQDTDEYYTSAGIAVNEVASGNGYTTKGEALASKTITYNAASNEVRIDADDLQWTSASFTARVAWMMKDTGNGATSPLLAYCVFSEDVVASGGNFDLTFDSTGILKVTASA
jgi:hypothetical protein